MVSGLLSWRCFGIVVVLSILQSAGVQVLQLVPLLSGKGPILLAHATNNITCLDVYLLDPLRWYRYRLSQGYQAFTQRTSN